MRLDEEFVRIADNQLSEAEIKSIEIPTPMVVELSDGIAKEDGRKVYSPVHAVVTSLSLDPGTMVIATIYFEGFPVISLHPLESEKGLNFGVISPRVHGTLAFMAYSKLADVKECTEIVRQLVKGEIDEDEATEKAQKMLEAIPEKFLSAFGYVVRHLIYERVRDKILGRNDPDEIKTQLSIPRVVELPIALVGQLRKPLDAFLDLEVPFSVTGRNERGEVMVTGGTSWISEEPVVRIIETTEEQHGTDDQDEAR